VIAALATDPPAAVADLGSGTGIFSRALLDAGYRETSAGYDRARATAASFIGPGVRTLELEHHQRVDAAGLIGRFFSSSFTPRAGTPEHHRASAELLELFSRCERGGEVELLYLTCAYLGRLGESR
jgi:hypothetical protein